VTDLDAIRGSRVDQVGSLLRPHALIESFLAHGRGDLSADELRRRQDSAVATVIAEQEAHGLPILSDGEYRTRHREAPPRRQLPPPGVVVRVGADREADQGNGDGARPRGADVPPRGVGSALRDAPGVPRRRRRSSSRDRGRTRRGRLPVCAARRTQLHRLRRPGEPAAHAGAGPGPPGEPDGGDQGQQRCDRRARRPGRVRPPHLPRQPGKHVAPGGALRRNRRSGARQPELRPPSPGVRHRAGRRVRAPALRAKGNDRRAGPRHHQGGRTRDSGRTPRPDRRCQPVHRTRRLPSLPGDSVHPC